MMRLNGRNALVEIKVWIMSASGQVYDSLETLELSGDQVDAINNKRQMGVAPWVKACCEIDLDVLSIREAEPSDQSRDEIPPFQPGQGVP